MKIISISFLFSILFTLPLMAQREHICIDKDWQFALGNAADPMKDFGCGTEYFNYLTKANSIHNTGPYSKKFKTDNLGNVENVDNIENADKSDIVGRKWKTVDLPHDWAVDLPFAPEASHSHGYKTLGWKYPETSVGWYRKEIILPKEDAGKRIALTFDGIFRNSQVWVNGFYCGGEPSGYVGQTYDVTDYVLPGDTMLICVRVDASLEEGWFYEGAGIYRHVWLDKTAPLHLKPDSHLIYATKGNDNVKAVLNINYTIVNNSRKTTMYRCDVKIIDAKGNVVNKDRKMFGMENTLRPRQEYSERYVFGLKEMPHTWSPASPYLYTVRTILYDDNGVCDSVDTKYGFRSVTFDKDNGLFINGKSIKIKGACLHQDHAGVGAAIPDELYIWRLQQLKKYGFNAIRSSHNPMSPALLAACDSLGILVIEENRLIGISDYQIGQLRKMIARDFNHPSVIAWSMGNEEWGVEWNEYGERIVQTMTDYSHLIDPTRPTTVATSSGPEPIKGADIAGYNYMMQNPIDELRKQYPDRKAYCSEETTGCGTRGVYFDASDSRTSGIPESRTSGYPDIQTLEASMPSLNRQPDTDGTLNRIARGWKFQVERPWMCGLFYWTGFDYRGEPNPLSYPATGSEFGILDYCGFPKDEAYYLKAWWTDEAVLHLLPHWNLKGHEGESIEVWAYSNCDEIELFVNGKSAGKKAMEKNGHLSWNVVYKPGKLMAVGYKNGKKTLTETVETTGEAVKLTTKEEKVGRLTVVTVEARDARGRLVPDANVGFTVTAEGGTRLLGVGNGNPSWQGKERPEGKNVSQMSLKTFNGLAQVLLMDGSDALCHYRIFCPK